MSLPAALHRLEARTWQRRAGVVLGLAFVLAGLGAAGVLPAHPSLHQHVALPPFDLFGDVRLLMAWAPSHLVLWPSVGAVLVARILLLALLLARFDGAVRRAALVYGVALVPAVVAAFLTGLGQSLLFARALWLAVAIAVTVAALTAAAPWSTDGRRFARRAGTVLAYAVVMAAIGAGAAVAEDAGVDSRAAAAAAVLLTGAATLGGIHLLERPAPAGPWSAVAALPVLALLWWGATTGFTWPWEGEPEPPATPREGSILLTSGIDSASGDGAILEIDPADLGYPCEQTFYFSYAGPGEGQPQAEALCPITTGAPYGAEHTFRPFTEQVDAMVAQLDGLPRPRVVAGHSQGAWVAWAAAARDDVDVDVLLLIGPFPDTLLGYPPPGVQGPGRVTGDLFRLLLPVIEANFDVNLAPDAPFTRDVLLHPGAAAAILAEPLPAEVRVLSIPAVEDLPFFTGGRHLDGAADACPVLHGHADMPRSPEVQRSANTFLDGEAQPSCSPLRELPGIVGRPFLAPSPPA